ncbi:hypothetical protein MKZ38_010728 [Zalerion maritima]|uniref:Uncharacterized protein n=1 Tax=Zalerion maritima TaxID=339359 RepID=A0AAD5RGE2_9PEZI|nr:hypothetical protein MKZ38_010728 [Zalerion maritima]
MQLPTTALLLAFFAGASSAGRLVPRTNNGMAAILGAFSDTNCHSEQTDFSQSADGNWGTCTSLGGSSMKIWWLAKGCEILTFNKDRECSTVPSHNIFTLNECINTSDDWSLEVYCILGDKAPRKHGEQN